jgi:hypothetical protein
MRRTRHIFGIAGAVLLSFGIGVTPAQRLASWQPVGQGIPASSVSGPMADMSARKAWRIGG